MPQTPSRSSFSQRRPAEESELKELLKELNIRPPLGRLSYELVSEWAAKHVWRIDVKRQPWIYVRYLLGAASRFPDRWRHMRLGEELHTADIGPRILGLTPESEALGGRAAVVESALQVISLKELESRASEVIDLFTRLHSNDALLEALSIDLNHVDIANFSPLSELITDTRERWFIAVAERWKEAELPEIDDLLRVVRVLMHRLDALCTVSEQIEIVVPAHNDPNHGNFVLNQHNELRMIDFESLALNNPVADLGVFLTWYSDRDRHRELLEGYPLADPDAVLERMRIWVPLRYLGISAHWSARLTRAKDQESWNFAVESIDEWLRGACELAFDGVVPADLSKILHTVCDSLLERQVISKDD